VVVPVMYSYMDDLSQWLRRRFFSQPGVNPTPR
jgi:hypothetical protein